jgi:predicted ArsR family transcriptional regulator
MTENGLMGPRQQIIAVLHAHGEPVSTSLLRRELSKGDEGGGDIDVLYHLGKLRERGLIDRAGDVRTGSEGRGQKAQSYRLTATGKERAEDLFGPVPTETVSALANRVESNATRIRNHDDRFDALADHEQVAALKQRVSDLEAQVESDSDVIDQLRVFLDEKGALDSTGGTDRR